MSEDLGGPWKARQESGSRIHGGLGGTGERKHEGLPSGVSWLREEPSSRNE